MKNKFSQNLIRAAILTGICGFAATPPALAAVYTWDGSGTNPLWDTSTNWVGNAIAFNNTADLVWHASGAARLGTGDNAIGDNRTIRSLTFNDNVTGSTNLRLTTTSGGTPGRTLSFEADSGNASLTVNSAASGDIRIGVAGPGTGNTIQIELVSALDVHHNGSGELWLDRGIGGSGALNKFGGGTLRLSSPNNNFSGTLTINTGVVRLTGSGVLGAGDLAVASGTFDFSDLTAAALTIGTGRELRGAGTIIATGKTLELEGALSPGNSIGTLTFQGGTFDISSAEDLIFELGGTADLVLLTGGADLDIGTLEFANFTFVPLAGFGAKTYTLFSGWDTLHGSVGASNTGLINGLPAELTISGNSLILSVIPEPSLLWPLLVLAGIWVFATKRRGVSQARQSINSQPF